MRRFSGLQMNLVLRSAAHAPSNHVHDSLSSIFARTISIALTSEKRKICRILRPQLFVCRANDVSVGLLFFFSFCTPIAWIISLLKPHGVTFWYKFHREGGMYRPGTWFFRTFNNHPFDVRSYTCTTLEQMMQNSGVVELKGTTSYSTCRIKWTFICATCSDVEAVLHDLINDDFFQPCPKLTWQNFRFRVACIEWFLDVST